ncbi:hypothetical protein ACFLRN_02325 [Thermoproteota archaeon]
MCVTRNTAILIIVGVLSFLTIIYFLAGPGMLPRGGLVGKEKMAIQDVSGFSNLNTKFNELFKNLMSKN